MKLAILNHYASVPKNGAAETRHYEIAKRFIKNGDEVHIFIGDYSHLIGKRWTELGYKNDFKYEDINFHIIKTREYGGNSLERFFSSVEYYLNGKKIIRDFDFDRIIASSPHQFSWALANYYVKKIKNIPFFIEIRDVWPDDLIASKSLKKNSIPVKIFDFMCKKYYPKSSGIVSLLPDLRDHFYRLNIKLDNISFIPNGISKEYNVVPCEIVDNLINKNRKIKIAYTGSLGPSNGLLEFLTMLNKLESSFLNNFEFYFIGPGQKKYKNKLKEIVKSRNNIFFMNPIPKKCIKYLFKNIDILLFSLKDFNEMKNPAVSSTKLMDYMYSKKPILSVYHEGLVLNETKDAIFYNNNDVSSLKEALNKILNDNLENYGQKNFDYIKQNRLWDKLFLKFNDFIR